MAGGGYLLEPGKLVSAYTTEESDITTPSNHQLPVVPWGVVFLPIFCY